MAIEMLLEYINTLNKLLNSPMNGNHRQVIEEKILAVCKKIDKTMGINNSDEVKIYADGIEIAQVVREQLEKENIKANRTGML
jgi:hypothetical protein